MARVSLEDVRFYCLLAALALYAFLGLPTPDQPGVVEGILAVLLICAVGLSVGVSTLQITPETPLWRGAGQGLLLYGLSAGLLGGLLRGQDVGLIARDLAPFLFMLMPVFLASLFEGRSGRFCAFLWAVLMVGAVFALRAVAEIGQDIVFLRFLTPRAAELTYLANAPTILFAALFLAGESARRLIERYTLKNAAVLAMALMGALVLCIPLVLSEQRASLGYGALYGVILAVMGLVRAPYRTLPVLGVIILCTLPFWQVTYDVAGALAHKTNLVGFNMRFEELAAVWHELAASPLGIVFGNGWGATFESPAVGGVRVNFTHSLLSSALLKTGVAGLLLTLSYLYGLGRMLLGFLKSAPILALALAGPFLIDIVLYASFKSLDFGLILLMIPAFALSQRSVA